MEKSKIKTLRKQYINRLLVLIAICLSIVLITNLIGLYFFSRLYYLGYQTAEVIFTQIWLPGLPLLVAMLAGVVFGFLKSRWSFLIVLIISYWLVKSGFLGVSGQSYASGFEYVIFMANNYFSLFTAACNLLALILYLWFGYLNSKATT